MFFDTCYNLILSCLSNTLKTQIAYIKIIMIIAADVLYMISKKMCEQVSKNIFNKNDNNVGLLRTVTQQTMDRDGLSYEPHLQSKPRLFEPHPTL